MITRPKGVTLISDVKPAINSRICMGHMVIALVMLVINLFQGRRV